MTGLVQYLADALHQLRSKPCCAAIIVGSLALGFGTIAIVKPTAGAATKPSRIAQPQRVCDARRSSDAASSPLDFSLHSYAHYQEIRQYAAQARKAERPCSGKTPRESSALRQEFPGTSVEKIRRRTACVCSRTNAVSG